jgi:hypothetical protein
MLLSTGPPIGYDNAPIGYELLPQSVTLRPQSVTITLSNPSYINGLQPRKLEIIDRNKKLRLSVEKPPAACHWYRPNAIAGRGYRLSATHR